MRSLCPASFSQDNVKVLPWCSMCQYFISFYCQIIFHRMDVSHFIYPVDGHLGCAHFLAVMISAALHVCTSFCVGVCFHSS